MARYGYRQLTEEVKRLNDKYGMGLEVSRVSVKPEQLIMNGEAIATGTTTELYKILPAITQAFQQGCASAEPEA